MKSMNLKCISFFELSNSWSDEGRFSKFRDKLVIGIVFKIAKELVLGKYLIMSKGKNKIEKVNLSV